MKRLLMLCVFALLMPAAYADVTAVEATVDKNPVMLDEAIRLTVTAEGDAERDGFDSSPLLKEFVVGRTSVSTQTSIINFDSRQTTTWTTTLFPRKVGSFTIPSFTIEGQTTQPITIKVIPVQDGAGQPARDYYVTTAVDTQSVYLHQQILYTVKLYLASNIERGSLQQPELPNAQIRQLGDDKQYSDIVNGKRYQIIERQFAIIPQQSGDFTIRGPVFSGEVLAANTNQRFGFFNRTQEINRVGPDVDINIKPVPADVKYHWLPSSFVQLNEEWQKDQTFTVGEPITRTVTLTAMGVVEEQLPELPQHYPPDFKLYPDQPTTTTVQKDNTLIAQRVEPVAMIPTKAGSYVLPEIKVPWFNVLTGETEYATLPARSVSVKPAAPGSGPAPTPVAASPAPVTQPQPQPVGSDAQESPAQVTGPIVQSEPGWMIWTLASLLVVSLLGWISSVVYLRKRTNSTHSGNTKTAVAGNSDESACYAALEQAIKKDNIGDAQLQLSRWFTYLHVHQASDSSLTAPLQMHIDAMLDARYGKQDQSWDKNAMLKTLASVRQQWQKQQSDTKKPLADLYPA